VTTTNAINKSSSNLSLTNTTNQLVLGTTNTTTVSSTAPASSVTITIPDAGASSNMLLCNTGNTKFLTGPAFYSTSNNFVTGNGAGSTALFADTTASNIVIGPGAGTALTNISAGNAIFIGNFAGQNATTASSVIGIGSNSCQNLSNQDNIGIGLNTIQGNGTPSTVTAQSNVAIGRNGLQNITTATGCITLGFSAGQNVSTGINNILIGESSGVTGTAITTGQKNILIGWGTGVNAAGAINRICIGDSISVTADNQAVIGNSALTTIINASTTGGCALGTTANPFGSAVLGTSSTSNVTISPASQAAARTYTIPDTGQNASFVMNLTADVPGPSQAIVRGSTYVANNGTGGTFTLPATATEGDSFRIIGKGAGLFSIAQNAGQLIHFDGQVTTTGVGGSITALGQYNAISIMCITTNTTWVVMNYVGNWTIV